MDTESLYAKNRAERANELRAHGWWDHAPFEYRFNAQGFRSDEFDCGQYGVLYLGCSFTMGEGLPAELTWPTMVSRALGLACWNLGQSGGSMDTCFRLAEHWVPRLRPVRVILMSTLPERLEIVDPGGVPRLYSAQGFSPGAGEWLAHPENARLNHLRNRWAIRALCESQSVPVSEWPLSSLCVKGSLGRDLTHPGIEAHRQFADTVLSHIQSAEDIQ